MAAVTHNSARPNPLARLRAVLHALGARVFGVRQQLAELRREAKALLQIRTEFQELRALHQRVAELTDVVAEVLVPLADRDEEQLAKRLKEYQRSSF